MTPSELANKIAEEVFRTIERERGIVKAEIVDAVEKVLAQEASHPKPVLDETFKQLQEAGSLPNPRSYTGRLNQLAGYGPGKLGSIGDAEMADPSNQGRPVDVHSLKFRLGGWKTVEVVPSVTGHDVEVPLRPGMIFLIDGKLHRVVAVTKGIPGDEPESEEAPEA